MCVFALAEGEGCCVQNCTHFSEVLRPPLDKNKNKESVNVYRRVSSRQSMPAYLTQTVQTRSMYITIFI